jgi:hypothetical protein
VIFVLYYLYDVLLTWNSLPNVRLQLANGEFKGVELVCTKSRHDTVKFLIHQLQVFQESFDPKHPPLRTRDSLTKYIDRQMKSPTFIEYLRLRSIPSIGDVKAMKVCVCCHFSN